MAGFRPEGLLGSYGNNRSPNSRFRGVQPNYEAIGNVFIQFKYFSMNFNNNNIKFRLKIFGLKIEKMLGVPLAFFPIFSSNFFLEFLSYYDWNLFKNTKNE